MLCNNIYYVISIVSLKKTNNIHFPNEIERTKDQTHATNNNNFKYGD